MCFSGENTLMRPVGISRCGWDGGAIMEKIVHA
jgi:hypothetical protein